MPSNRPWHAGQAKARPLDPRVAERRETKPRCMTRGGRTFGRNDFTSEAAEREAQTRKGAGHDQRRMLLGSVDGEVQTPKRELARALVASGVGGLAGKR
jgi:hypothetical protein